MKRIAFPRLLAAAGGAGRLRGRGHPGATYGRRPGIRASAAVNGSYLVQFKGNGVSGRLRPAGGRARRRGELCARGGIGAVAGLSADGAAALAASGVAAVDADATRCSRRRWASAQGSRPTALVESPSTGHGRALPAAVAHARHQADWPGPQAAAARPRQGRHPGHRAGLHAPGPGGRVDLPLSKSFVPVRRRLVAALFPGAHPIADLHYHGTHVGATVGSNGVAAAGVTRGTTLIGVRSATSTGSCPTSGVLRASCTRPTPALHVINMSLGGLQPPRRQRAGGNGPSFLAMINRAFNYAHRKGTTVVVSAGNYELDLDHDGNGYKAYCSSPNVVCVSATGPTQRPAINGPWTNVDALAGYSNYGRSAISVAAPGGNAVAVSAACSHVQPGGAGLPHGHLHRWPQRHQHGVPARGRPRGAHRQDVGRNPGADPRRCSSRRRPGQEGHGRGLRQGPHQRGRRPGPVSLATDAA